MIAIIASACGGSAATTAPSAATSAAAPSAAATSAASAAPASASAAAAATPSATPLAITPAPIAQGPGPNGGKVVRWFIGLGSGGKPEQVAAEQKFADGLQRRRRRTIYLSVEIYDNSVAANQLQIQIAAGNPPDIIGPVGVEGLNIFRDNLLDLAPLITSQNFDMTKFDPALADFFKMGKNGATIGVPYATYPSFIYYNKKLFDEAKLPYPPTKVGEHVQRQAVGHGGRARARHEADGRQERQRRDERGLRPREHRPVGLRHAVGGRPRRQRGDDLRRQLRRRRRRQDRPDHRPSSRPA